MLGRAIAEPKIWFQLSGCIESINDNWTAVFEDNLGGSLHINNTDFELFQEQIVKQWDRGYEIVALEQIENT